MAPNVKRSWAGSLLLSTNWAERVHISLLGDGSVRVIGSPLRLGLKVAGIDEIQRRTDLTKPAGGHMQVKCRSH
jgi:hypothetical protein